MRGCGTHRTWGPAILLLLSSWPATASAREAGSHRPASPATEADRLRLPETALDAESRIVHVLNRLGYGPGPGDVSRVRRLGLAAYIEAQLRPETLDDRELDRRLKPLTTLSMTTAQRLAAFPPRRLLQAAARRFKNDLTEAQRAELLPEIGPAEARQNRADRKAARTSDPRQLAVRKEAGQAAPGPRVISDELAQAKLIRAVYGRRQLEEVMTDFWFNHFNVYVGKGAVRWWAPDYEKTAIRPHALGRFRELLGAVARHPAMLFYLDNWLSSASEGGIDATTLQLLAITEGRKRGLPPGGLPMLVLRQRGLDTTELERRIDRRDSRRRERRQARGRVAPAPAAMLRSRAGLNENYARELLELHTLGVDGPYTQEDIVEVARCFTGWSLLPLPAGQTFVYVEALHDKGPKVVLGQTLEAGGGLEDGEAVLDLLAKHPSTARFVSTKLARRFVRDDPPGPLIERMAATFGETDGDIRAVLRTLFESPEFWSPEAFQAKVKTPFEFVASAARATAAEMAAEPARAPAAAPASQTMTPANSTAAGMDAAMEPARGTSPRHTGANGLVRSLHAMGQPLYGCPPPTGYDDRADVWVSAGALMHRMKMALGLAANRLRGVETDLAAGLGRGRIDDDALNALAVRLTGQSLPPETLRLIHEQLDLSSADLENLGLPAGFNRSPRGPARMAAGWILATAEFQRR